MILELIMILFSFDQINNFVTIVGRSWDGSGMIVGCTALLSSSPKYRIMPLTSDERRANMNTNDVMAVDPFSGAFGEPEDAGEVVINDDDIEDLDLELIARALT